MTVSGKRMRLLSKSIISLLLPLLAIIAPDMLEGNDASTNRGRKATVKIFNTYTRPDFCTPWKTSGPHSATGSGAILKNRLILTNAHVVSDSTFLQVQKENDPTLYNAEVVFTNHACDLALLKVKDTAFYRNTAYLELGGIPRLRSKVTTYGYPQGGERISITEGIVSRIEMGTYHHSGESAFLTIQTDAAINPGNSGGPVVQNGKIAGVAFQVRKDSANIGYMIPTPIIRHFLTDVRLNRTVDGFPSLGIFTSNLQNEDLRAYFGMAKSESGILVTHVVPGGSSARAVRKDDVLLTVNGIPIANDASVAFGDGRVGYGHVIDVMQIGEQATLTLLRNKKHITVRVTLKDFPYRIPWNNSYELRPRYVIIGGIIFQPLSKDYLQCWDKWWYNANRRMLYYYTYYLADEVSPQRQEFVIINHVLPDIANAYISDIKDLVVKKINGIDILKLEDVVTACAKPVNGHHVIVVEGTNLPIILSDRGLRAANTRIRQKFAIPALIRLDKHKTAKD